MPRWRAADRNTLLQLKAVLVVLLALAAAFAARVTAAQPLSAVDEQSARSERSANLSHITGPARKIRMYVRHGCLQLQPDGSVSSSNDHMSPYTILQRWSVGPGQLKIQGVASCMHLCLDPCGLLYGSREMNDECVFNEMMEQHHYNTYSSAKYSNTNRTVYLALDRAGLPRKVQVKAGTPLGKLSKWTRVLTQTVATPPASPASCPAPPPPSESRRCRRKRKKKKRRKCPPTAAGGRPCGLHDEESTEDNARLLRRKCDGKPCRLLVTNKKVAASNVRPRKKPARHQTRHLHHLRHVHRPQADEPAPNDDPFDLEEDDDDVTAAPDAIDDEFPASDLPPMLLVDANDK